MGKTDILPGKFLYSQQSLLAFEQCPLMFRKRYIEKMRWESIFDKDQKKAIERGKNFHLLAKRYFLGIYSELESMRTTDEVLDFWLSNLEKDFRLETDKTYLPEHSIIMHSEKLRLQAIPDLAIIKNDSIEIWDWKTHNSLTSFDSERSGKRLKESMQTKIYLFMMREYAASKGGNLLKCSENISMQYWQPDPHGIIASISYDDKAHEENRIFIENSISSIENYNWEDFDKILYSKNCRRCEFNWMCNGPAADASGIRDNS